MTGGYRAVLREVSQFLAERFRGPGADELRAQVDRELAEGRTPFGYAVGRDLGDGRVEWWESSRSEVPTYVTAGEAREVADRYGASRDVWDVIALTVVLDALETR